VQKARKPAHPSAGPRTGLGAVGYLHRFGSALIPHGHFHCNGLDGVVDSREMPRLDS